MGFSRRAEGRGLAESGGLDGPRRWVVFSRGWRAGRHQKTNKPGIRLVAISVLSLNAHQMQFSWANNIIKAKSRRSLIPKTCPTRQRRQSGEILSHQNAFNLCFYFRLTLFILRLPYWNLICRWQSAAGIHIFVMDIWAKLARSVDNWICAACAICEIWCGTIRRINVGSYWGKGKEREGGCETIIFNGIFIWSESDFI